MSMLEKSRNNNSDNPLTSRHTDGGQKQEQGFKASSTRAKNDHILG